MTVLMLIIQLIGLGGVAWDGVLWDQCCRRSSKKWPGTDLNIWPYGDKCCTSARMPLEAGLEHGYLSFTAAVFVSAAHFNQLPLPHSHAFISYGGLQGSMYSSPGPRTPFQTAAL